MNKENTQHIIFDRRHRMCPERISLLGERLQDRRHHGGADTGKFASSTTDLINSMLNNRQYGESQKKVLRTALQYDGKIPYAAYRTAWGSYKQCLVERGYTKPPQNQSNGVYFTPTYVSSEGLSDAQSRKLDEDIDECKDLHVSAIDLVYRTQLGNPEFYGDPEVALIDCLHRGNLIPTDYTINKYRQQFEEYRNDTKVGSVPDDWFNFDLNDSAVLTCLASNKSPLLQTRLEAWKPFG